MGDFKRTDEASVLRGLLSVTSSFGLELNWKEWLEELLLEKKL